LNDTTTFLDEAPRPLPVNVFDLCHVGVVLRAVVGVLAVLALGTGVSARDAGQWSMRFSEACTVALPAVLLWLTSVCGAQRLLARWPLGWAAPVLAAYGAVCVLLPWSFVNAWLSDTGELPLVGAFTAGASGALAAAVLLQGLRLRAKALGPTGMQARLVELQSRIRPHFLFNTLNTAVALVRLDPQRAERVLEDLAELFQAALAAPEGTSTLGQEIALARRYLDIEQLRFGERLRIEWQLDPGADAAVLPPLLLQPLVENAVRHGVEPNADGGELLVRTRCRGDRVELLVRNTLGAVGHPGNGMALDNVRERLLLMHDVAAQCQIDRSADRFSVKLSLPLAAAAMALA
jgi:two-component system, LytTR family, sensor histidine kinase AlgZ